MRESQVQSLLSEQTSNSRALAGLFAALMGMRIVGTVLARPLGGRAAFVWPPRIAEPNEELADRLLARACQWCQESGITLAQALLADDADLDRQRLLRGGFTHAADLLYLLCPDREFPRQEPASGLDFEPYSPGEHERFKQVVGATYEQSLDCPSIDGLRDLDDVLAGYRATGVFDPGRWFIVRRAASDVGCLILSDDPVQQHWELTYMGVVAGSRGAGLGLSIVRHAQWLAGCAGRRRLVLSVDASNDPALDMYSRAGFIAWERRAVFVKSFKA